MAAAEERRLALGRRLRALREERRLTLRDVAAKTGLSIGHLSDVERGQKAISVDRLWELADLFGVEAIAMLPSGHGAGAYWAGHRAAIDAVARALDGLRK